MESQDSTITIKSTINEIYAITEVTQSYTNASDNPIELKASFPIKEGVQLTKFTVTIGTKTIVSKIADKEKAKEKVSDAIASGNTGVYVEYGSSTDTQEVSIGNLQPKEKVTMKSEYMQMISSSDMSYQVSLIQNYPCFIANSQREKYDILIGTVDVKCKSKLTRLVAKQENTDYIITKQYNQEYTQCEMSITYSGSPSNNEYPTLTFLFRTANINKPTLYAQYDPIRKESSYVLNYIYSSNSVKEIPIPEQPDEDASVCYYTKYQEDVVNDTPSLFIFLIDQSGSMSGKPIQLVKKCLQYFMKSLPLKSYFQLIGFGSNYKTYNEKPIEYNEENVSSTMKIIEELTANLGGTNISSPLKEIYNSKQYDGINLSKNIFMLTDGEVDNRQECISLCRDHADKFRVHAVGLGTSFDRKLINECGKQGNGSSSFCTEIEKVNSTVIECVNKCLRSYLYDSSFDVKDSLYHYPEKKVITYQDDVINYSFMKQGEIIKDKFDIPFTATNPIDNTAINQTISIESPEEIEEGDTLAKIIIGNLLKEGKVNNQVELSKKYQVLSKETALYGEIKNEGNNEQGELIQVNLNTEQKKEYDQYLDRELMKAMLYKSNKNYLDFDGGFIHRGSDLCTACPPLGAISKKKNSINTIKVESAPKGAKMSVGFHPFKKVGNFFSNLFKKKESYEVDAEPVRRGCCEVSASPYSLSGVCNSKPPMKDLDYEVSSAPVKRTAAKYDSLPIKKPITSSDTSIKGYDDLILQQSITEGYWSKLDITMSLFSKGKVKEVYEQVKKYIEANGGNLSEEDKDRVISTFTVIYFIIVENPDKKVESKLIVNKAKKYLESKNMNYDTLLANIKV